MKFLISATHVLEPEFVSSMTIPNGEELVQIRGRMVVTAIPVRKDDKIDLAVVSLEADCAEDLMKRFNFLEFVSRRF